MSLQNSKIYDLSHIEILERILEFGIINNAL